MDLNGRVVVLRPYSKLLRRKFLILNSGAPREHGRSLRACMARWCSRWTGCIRRAGSSSSTAGVEGNSLAEAAHDALGCRSRARVRTRFLVPSDAKAVSGVDATLSNAHSITDLSRRRPRTYTRHGRRRQQGWGHSDPRPLMTVFTRMRADFLLDQLQIVVRRTIQAGGGRAKQIIRSIRSGGISFDDSSDSGGHVIHGRQRFARQLLGGGAARFVTLSESSSARKEQSPAVLRLAKWR